MRFDFFSVLTLIFVWAKLVGHINWSWWLVLSPMIVMLTFVAGSVALAAYLKIKRGNL
jgi:hypothetical protein